MKTDPPSEPVHDPGSGGYSQSCCCAHHGSMVIPEASAVRAHKQLHDAYRRIPMRELRGVLRIFDHYFASRTAAPPSADTQGDPPLPPTVSH